MITVFTPTYNREAYLLKLFESLCAQTSKNFEWLIVDDGSSDNTDILITELSAKDLDFPIRYFKQPNGGKHRAINYGVKEAKGELFFIVDSDDRLLPDAVEWIENNYEQIRGNALFAGLSGIRVYPDGSKIGEGGKFEVIDADAIEIRTKHHVHGDMAEVYRTDIMREYPFPDIAGEKFCSEGLIWGRIAQKYKLRYYYKGIYVCEYLNGGLTATRYSCRVNSPNYSMLLYSELIRHPNSLKGKVAYALNFWRFGSKSETPFIGKCKLIGFPWFILAPIGWIMSKFLPQS